MTLDSKSEFAAAALAGVGTFTGVAVSLPDPVRAAVVALMSAVIAWATTWLLNRITKLLGG